MAMPRRTHPHPGLYSHCKECKLLYDKDYRERHYDPPKPQKPDPRVIHYQKNRKTLDAQNQAWRKKNPKKTRAIYRRYYRKHREQAMQKSFNRQSLQKTRGNGKRINRLEIYHRDGGICHLCHRKVSPKHFSLDHLIPLSKGGLHIPSNVALAHTKCNNLRGPGRWPAQLRLF